MSSILRNNERKQIKRELNEFSDEDIIKELRKRSNKNEEYWALIWVDVRTLTKNSQPDKSPKEKK